MPQVTVEQGSLRGQQCDNYVAFKGIPYGKPPVGALRFMAPQPAEAWQGVRDATRHGHVCPQYNDREKRLQPGSEDCLYLNVYTRRLDPPAPLPVMVWIHGGAFYTGSGDADFYGPDFIVENDVVLVTLNYRLEVLGFLCLDNELVPGNAGLRDQTLALKWVKRNIRAFGGDPDNVTIFGCSAGSAAVSYHMVSRHSEGLFHRAICQSGVCLNDWSYSPSPYARQRAFQLAKQLGKETEDEYELLDFLRSVPVMSLVHISLPKITRDVSDSILFGPVIEKVFPGVEPFLCESPLDLLNKGEFSKVPLMIGYTSSEGIEIARYFPHMSETRNKSVENNLPRELKLKWDQDKIEKIGDIVKKFYFEEKPISDDTMQELVTLETDLHFTYNIMRFAKLIARVSPVYLYRLSCETERNHIKINYSMTNVDGVCHGDDLPYLFNISHLERTLNPETRDLIRRIVALWTNFAKTGNPTLPDECEVAWRPFEEANKNYLIIDKVFQSSNNPDNKRMEFWDIVYENIS